MGRELRKVPANWEHPKRSDGKYQPMFDESYREALAKWEDARDKFVRGIGYDDEPLSESANKYTFEEWHGEAPDPVYYRPDWSDEERTHFQMYQNTSEGSPISPVFATPEECARYCADKGVSAFGYDSAPYEWWIRVCEGSAGFGLMIHQPSGVTELA